MDTQLTSRHQRVPGFIEYLCDLAKPESSNRAALAALRRGLGKSPGEAAEMFPYVVPWVPNDPKEWEEAPYYLVASLFALHPLPWPESDATSASSRTFGASMAKLIATPDRLDAVERRFVALLNAHPEDIGDHLRRNVALLKAADIPVDWAQLLTDLLWWDHPQRRVQRRWARSFWTSVARISPEQRVNTPEVTDSDVVE